MTIAQTLQVALDARSYPIHIGAGTLREAGRLLTPMLAVPRTVVVTNPTVAKAWLTPLRDSLAGAGIVSEALLIPDGEAQHKSCHAARCLDPAARAESRAVDHDHRARRRGGRRRCGIRGSDLPARRPARADPDDVACAGRFVRGWQDRRQPPTRQEHDRRVPPAASRADRYGLSATLPDRELSAGLAEVVKYGAIRERGFFDWLEANADALIARDSTALTRCGRRKLSDQGGDCRPGRT